MTGPIGTDLLGRACLLLDSLQLFANAYLEYQRGETDKLHALQTAWAKLLPVCIEVENSTSSDAGELADWICDAGQWFKRFSVAVDSRGFADAVVNDHCDGIIRIVQSGRQIIEPQSKKDEPVANPAQELSTGNTSMPTDGNQALGNGDREINADRRVESNLSEPDDSLTDDAIESLKKWFNELPNEGTAQVNQVIADAVKDGFQRNAVEWALVRMQEYGWIKLSIPVWDGVIGEHPCDAKNQEPAEEPGPNRWYFGAQDYSLRVTEYFYNPSYCRTCSKPLSGHDHDRSECYDCRSPDGKLAELNIVITCQKLYGNDYPERIGEWPMILAFLRDRFGTGGTNAELWDWMKSHLRVVGWNEEQWLRMRYGEFIDRLKSGLLTERPIAEPGDLKLRDKQPTESDESTVEKAIENPTAQNNDETPKECSSALIGLGDPNFVDVLTKRFIEVTGGFSDDQWSEKVDRRIKARANERRGRNTRSFFVEGVGGIYYGDDRTYVFRGDEMNGYYSLAATHSQRIGKIFATEFSLNRR